MDCLREAIANGSRIRVRDPACPLPTAPPAHGLHFVLRSTRTLEERECCFSSTSCLVPFVALDSRRWGLGREDYDTRHCCCSTKGAACHARGVRARVQRCSATADEHECLLCACSSLEANAAGLHAHPATTLQQTASPNSWQREPPQSTRIFIPTKNDRLPPPNPDHYVAEQGAVPEQCRSSHGGSRCNRWRWFMVCQQYYFRAERRKRDPFFRCCFVCCIALIGPSPARPNQTRFQPSSNTPCNCPAVAQPMLQRPSTTQGGGEASFTFFFFTRRFFYFTRRFFY